MKQYITAHYIARMLGVSPPTVYDWLARSQGDKWFHALPPAPVATADKNPKPYVKPTMLWDSSQVYEWVAWYEMYRRNKGKKPAAEQGNEAAS